jgi:hypothetical protein
MKIIDFNFGNKIHILQHPLAILFLIPSLPLIAIIALLVFVEVVFVTLLFTPACLIQVLIDTISNIKFRNY